MKQEKIRCSWCLKDDLYMRYHDEEWGVPVFDDQKMFEFLILETFQAGLSWYTVLSKRENFEKAFMQFNPQKMAAMNDKQIEALMQNPGIIRNRAKINAAAGNAKAYLNILNSGQKFSDIFWKHTGFKTLQNHIGDGKPLQATSPESDALSKELKSLGFAFVGSTVCYAHMQATGMVNDHHQNCFRYKELLHFETL